MNVCIYRIPKGESIAFPPSHCSQCKHALSPLDLIPVVSYLFLRGRCRYCKEKIAIRYPLVELMTALLTLAVYVKYGFDFKTGIYLLLVYAVIVASFIDLDHRIIPDSVNLFLGITGFLFLFTGFTVNWKQGLLGALIGGGVLLLLGYFALWFLRKEGMGGGDIKLLAACGLYLGMGKTIMALILSAYIALIIILVLFIAKRYQKDQYIPYGPFISAGVITVVLFYQDILNIYVELLYR